jgi:rhodanese-related sulfurtransferase
LKTVKEIDKKALSKLTNYTVVDIREIEEFTSHNIGGLNIPAHLLNENLALLQSSKKIVVVCSNGTRSHIMARVMQKKIPSAQIYHLTEGIE